MTLATKVAASQEKITLSSLVPIICQQLKLQPSLLAQRNHTIQKKESRVITKSSLNDLAGIILPFH